MEEKNKEEILNKIEELVQIIKDSDDYKRYLYLKEEMKKNKTLMSLINKIKKKEQELVNKEYRKENVDMLKQEIDSLNEELYSYPSYQEYLYLLEDINNNLQNVRQIIEEALNK